MNLFIKIVLALLAGFTPFAFAGAEPWAFSVVQTGIIACAVLWLLNAREVCCLTKLSKPVIFIFSFLVFLGLVQMYFSQTLLDSVPHYPISLMPLFTAENLSVFITYTTLSLLIMQVFSSQDSMKPFLYWLAFCFLAVAICTTCFSNGEYIRYFTGMRLGIGPFLNRNHAAVFLAMGALTMLGLIFAGYINPDKHHLHREQRQRFYVEQTCGWVIFIALAGSTIFTRSRGGAMALLCGVFCFAFLAVWYLPKSSKTKIKGTLITSAALAGVIYWITTHIAFINAFAFRSQDTSSEIRLMLYESATHLLEQYPLWGIGIGALPVALPAYMAYPLNRYVEHLHNDWLEIILGVGYVGIIPVICAIGYFIYLALGRLKHLPRHKTPIFLAAFCALITMGVGSLVDFHFFITANALFFFIFLGVMCLPTYDKHRLSCFKIPYLVRLLLVVLLLATLYVPFQKTMAWRSSLFGQGLKQEAKLAQYHAALAYYPAPRTAVQLGNAYFNASLRAQTPEQAAQYRQQAFEIARTYLMRYPKEPALSQLYVRTRPQ